MYVCKCKCIHAYVYIYVCMCIYTYMCSYICMYASYIHIYQAIQSTHKKAVHFLKNPIFMCIHI